MAWRVVERKVGRAGGVKRRTARQRGWDREYGERRWAVGYIVDGGNTPKAIVPRTTDAAARRANTVYAMPLPSLPGSQEWPIA